MHITWASVIINVIILIATFLVMIGKYYSSVQTTISLSQGREAPSVFKEKSKIDFYLGAWN